MFETISKGFRAARERLTGKGELSEDVIDEALKDVRMSLLGADGNKTEQLLTEKNWQPDRDFVSTAPVTAEAVGAGQMLVAQVPVVDQIFWAGYSCVTWLPATAAPIGQTEDGLPIGVQIIGPQYADYSTIAFAKLLEKEYRGFVPPPSYA